MLKNDYVDAKIGVDTAENEPFQSGDASVSLWRAGGQTERVTSWGRRGTPRVGFAAAEGRVFSCSHASVL